ncbi:MAG: hypothetical protein ACK41T_01355 [Pseudobdellovibrio sp.]
MKPEEIITHVHEIKKLTQNPFAINLYVSNVDKEAKDIQNVNYKKTRDLIDCLVFDLEKIINNK